METNPALAGLRCVDCGEHVGPDEAGDRCGACGGILGPEYDFEQVDLDASSARGSMWEYAPLLPFRREAAVTLGEGGTPLVECPTLADELGVDRLLVKDEGRNPTGTIADRGASVATTAAREAGVSDVSLATAGDAGQATAAYAARGGLDAHVFVPSRAGFVRKAMVNVHGADMTVVEGRLDDATDAHADELADHADWWPVGAFRTPYRHEGAKTVLYETVADLGTVPDAVVSPTGDGVTSVGLWKAARELRALGVVDALPALYAAQSDGCAPIVRAFEEGRERHEPWERPDTICGGIEVPDPVAGHLVLDALRETDGGAVATSDDDVLESAAAVASREGIEMGATGGAAASGAWSLAERGTFDADDTVVLINPGAGSKDSDVLRSHLMSRGI